MCSMRMEKHFPTHVGVFLERDVLHAYGEIANGPSLFAGVGQSAPCAWKNGNWDGKGRDPGTHHSIRMEGQQPLQRVPHTWIS